MSSLEQLHRIVKTVVSPYHELLCSLHVLYQPEHHPKRLAWAKEIRAAMPAALLEDICTLGRLTDQWLGLMHPGHSGTPLTSTEGISLLKGLPDAELIHLLLRNKASLGTILEWQQAYERGKFQSDSGPDEASAYLLLHLVSIRKQLIATLETYEQNYFRKEWDDVMPWIDTAAAQFQEKVSRSAEKALNTLHPRLRASEGKFTAQKAETYYFAYEDLRHVYVLPSTFIFPHLLIDWTTDSLLLPLAVDMPDLPFSEAPPEDLLRQFKALGDATRLRILKLLWQGPHCTKQLAPILGISEAAVSKQLKLLNEAGLTSAERKGNYLFYTSRKEAFDSLIVLQRQYLEQ
ncbi:ArsR/SmtB family transcription factor [Paenibacillus sp. HW567]|uniref:ArsR/SmtB family transcription factor n=1 Tax=Paenibacillus sp. HW567 TaxID=1034769 RepID=UPI00035F2F1A|nr:metalloregulator ArsR/SmtB family transcription factor [Paenibacillus sp. HW567]